MKDQACVQRLWAVSGILIVGGHGVVVLDPRTGKLVQIRVPARPQPKPTTQNTKLWA